MLVYDPQKDVSQWVPVRGMSALLTLSELWLANDLNNMNPYPYDRSGLAQPHSPRLVQGIPMEEEEESDTDSCGEPSDSGEEWDKAEHGNWSGCPAPPLGEEGPRWIEATALQRKIIADKQAPMWEEVVSDPPQRKVITDKEDSDWDDDTHVPVESQFEDATTTETCMDTTEEPTADSPWEENVVEALVGLGSQDMVQIHVGNKHLD